MPIRLLSLVVLVCGCGASSPPPAEPATTPEPTSEADRPSSEANRTTDVLLIGSSESAAPAPSEARPEAPGPVMPRGRSAAAPLASEPALAAGDLAYQRAMAISLDVGVQPDAGLMVDELLARVRARLVQIGEAQRLYARDATVPALRVLAHLRVGDLMDALGADMTTIVVAMPAEIEALMEGASEAVRTQIETEVNAAVASALAQEAHTLFCSALGEYERALAIDPLAARAHAQRLDYGLPFAGSCPREE